MRVVELIETLFFGANLAVAAAIAVITWQYGKFLKDTPYLRIWRVQYLVSAILVLVLICEIIGVTVIRVRAFLTLAALVVFSYICYRTVHFMQEYITTQQKTILGLSTPSIQVSEGILVTPLIGVLDEARAKHLTETLLQDITRTRAKTVIIDVTGILTIDTKTASHLSRIIHAMKLMGTHVIITGIRPQVSETMTHLGVSFESIPTLRDIPQALEYMQKNIQRT